MQSSAPLVKPRPAPDAIRHLATRLEERGIAVWRHGDGLLTALQARRERPPAAPDAAPSGGPDRGRPIGRSLICTADASTLLSLLPTAVVTASQARRLSLTTPDGPVDLLPIVDRPLESVLVGFGLGALGLAWRETGDQWGDPVAALADFMEGRMAATTLQPNPFLVAPRRLWIAARLLAEYGLTATPDLLALAQEAIGAGERATSPPRARRARTGPPGLALGAPARHELARVLTAPRPECGLAFLAESGATSRLFPGIERPGEAIIGDLPRLPALRWAVWLQGCPLQQALVGLRMPPALGRAIARLQQAHPIDRTLAEKSENRREAGLRKLLQRLAPDEIDGLILWRQHELAGGSAAASDLERLHGIRLRIEQLREERARSLHTRQLELDGEAVMALLETGPGRHVGRALAHLARFVLAHPEANARAPLEAELRRWAADSASKERIG